VDKGTIGSSSPLLLSALNRGELELVHIGV
jgi:hypothetical protein